MQFDRSGASGPVGITVEVTVADQAVATQDQVTVTPAALGFKAGLPVYFSLRSALTAVFNITAWCQTNDVCHISIGNLSASNPANTGPIDLTLSQPPEA